MNIALVRRRLSTVAGVLLTLALLGLFFCAGAYLGQETTEPEVVTQYQIETKVTERVVYEPVEKVVVEKVEVPRKADHFNSVEELELWLSDNSIFASDCDDYALALQQMALGDGYIVSFEVIYTDEYNRVFKQKRLPPGTAHAVNLAVIGNEVYYIEPQNHEIAFAVYLD